MRLTMKERKAVTAVMLARYRRASKKQKGRDELVALTGYNRWYAVGLLRGHGRPPDGWRGRAPGRPRPRRRVYDAAVLAALLDFHEPGLRLIPFGKGANRDLVLEQRPRLGPAAPAYVQPPALRSQQPVDARGADCAQLLPRARSELQLAVPFEHRDDLGQHRRQALATDTVHDHPNLPQGGQHRRIVNPPPWPRPP